MKRQQPQLMLWAWVWRCNVDGAYDGFRALLLFFAVIYPPLYQKAGHMVMVWWFTGHKTWDRKEKGRLASYGSMLSAFGVS